MFYILKTFREHFKQLDGFVGGFGWQTLLTNYTKCHRHENMPEGLSKPTLHLEPPRPNEFLTNKKRYKKTQARGNNVSAYI